jgi:preprotein translocase subunit YajC
LAAAGEGSGYQTVIFLAMMFAMFYFVLIRPQQKQQKEHKAMMSALKKGDEVITQGGIVGKIYAVTDKLITLEIANNVRVRVLKSSIQGKSQLGEEPAPAAKPEEKEQK